MASDLASNNRNSYRKWLGFVWLVIEMNLVTTNIFGFPALFKVLPKYGVYQGYCQPYNDTNSTSEDCHGQSQQYQNALTLGIICFNLPSIFVGISIDKFDCRFTKLIGVLFYIIGWLSLAFIESDKCPDALLYVHTSCISLAGSIILLTGYVSLNYFMKSRALLLTIFVGSSCSSSIWYSIFQVLIDRNMLSLFTLSCIWLSFSVLLIVSSFLFLDWEFPILNIPYKFDTPPEQDKFIIEGIEKKENSVNLKWYQEIHERVGIWEHLTNPLYISTVLLLAFLMMPNILLSVTWYPWVYHLNNEDKPTADNYTFAFNISSCSSIILCSIIGFILTFRIDRDERQKVFNIAIVQTGTLVLNVVACIINMFYSMTAIIPALIFFYLGKSAVITGSQAVIFTLFPRKYSGSLIGIMWTITGIITCIQYGLVQLTKDITQSWRAWIIVLVLVLMMSCHVVQLWILYYKKSRKRQSDMKIAKEFFDRL